MMSTKFQFRIKLCYSMNLMPVTMAGSENETSFAAQSI
jgi:hypothetical protein